MSLLAIDPGVNAIGYARWNDGDHHRPSTAGVIEPHKIRMKGPWERRVQEVSQELRRRGLLSSLGAIAMEWPEVMGGAKGHAAAARGDVSRLAYCCGAIAALCDQLTKIHLIPVTTWKGQLKKEIVTVRLMRLIGDKDKVGFKIETHAWDAIGVGLYVRGLKLNDPMFGANK